MEQFACSWNGLKNSLYPIRKVVGAPHKINVSYICWTINPLFGCLNVSHASETCLKFIQSIELEPRHTFHCLAWVCQGSKPLQSFTCMVKNILAREMFRINKDEICLSKLFSTDPRRMISVARLAWLRVHGFSSNLDDCPAHVVAQHMNVRNFILHLLVTVKVIETGVGVNGLFGEAICSTFSKKPILQKGGMLWRRPGGCILLWHSVGPYPSYKLRHRVASKGLHLFCWV